MKIFYKSNNRLSQYEAESKGYREDVIVNFNNLYYKVNIYDSVRIIQDFQIETKDGSFFDIPNNLILVKSVTNENIIHTVSKLIESGYFENLLPINVNIKEYKEVFSHNDDFDYNEYRTKTLAKRLNFDFSKKHHNEIRELLKYEIENYNEGSSEYIRFLCGYLYCIGDVQDIALIKKAKYSINMDVGCMVDFEWIESLKNGGVANEDECISDRSTLVHQFIEYYTSYFDI